MAEAVIVAAGRSAIGRASKGSLADTRPDELLGHIAREVLARTPISPGDIDDFIIGCTMPYGEATAINVTRGATFLAGLPETVPSVVVNRFCSSSLEAIRMAFHSIKADEATTILVGGVESVSRSPFPASDMDGLHPRFAAENAEWKIYMTMGETAENVADRFGIGRDEMDRFAQQSQERAVRAQRDGTFDREIIAFTKANGSVVAVDDGPRPASTVGGLAQLQPIFRENGRVTAGNSCPLNDGAAAVIVTSEAEAERLGMKPLARILSTGVSGLDPAIMGVGPIEAVRKALKQARMSMGDVGVMELNEAFASQVLAVCHELGLDPFSDRLNPNGGAIALGHPFGQTGCRIMTTLLNDLKTLDRAIGVETMCVGGGMGLAMVIERLN
ncbi:MAG: thiolase family protein [Candidatus Dormibacteria bacterium]